MSSQLTTIIELYTIISDYIALVIFHQDYLDDFCEHFEINTMRLIDESMADLKKRELDKTLSPVYNEVLQHLHACQHHCSVFQGQESILNLMAQYITNTSNLPLIIYGQSGCGKTSIMAKSYHQVRFIHK